MRLKTLALTLCVSMLIALCSCGGSPETASAPLFSFTDALGSEVSVSSCSRVVSLYGSFAEAWLLAGGTLVGTTEDAITERGLNIGEASVIGTVKHPNTEEILALSPDFVILSADIEADTALGSMLSQAGIPHAYYRVDTFEDYLSMLSQFCEMTNRPDLYEKNGAAVEAQVNAVREAVKGSPQSTALLIRAFSSGAKAKGDDILAGAILSDLGAKNIVSEHEFLLEELSLEEIISADPDFIFIVPMGESTQSAIAYLKETLEANPAWQTLSAVKNGKYYLLPKELFHYKPNTRWGESYAYLARLLYPEIADEL